ncbi:hypothetical protein LSH36_248g02013 [Paralvinella palmiformis]|uniref:DUF4773 domain-containing protein n=1 Tax=Paralvinella palmiformis TaxID=53620 RepID=A0AAD9N2V3_9ANNE|nr:hypothetical protein LSH36_248g02013 [Paralvinella palmiformis]
MMAHLGFHVGWLLLLLLLQPAFGWINLHEVYKIVNEIPDVDVHKMVKSAENDIKDVDQVLKKVATGVQDLTDVILSALEKVDHSGCKCVDYNCGCCLDLKIPSIQLDDTARNPPSICFDIPNLKEIASACVEFYDLDISSSNFHGCIRVELELIHVKLVHEDLGCFNIPVKENMT